MRSLRARLDALQLPPILTARVRAKLAAAVEAGTFTPSGASSQTQVP